MASKELVWTVKRSIVRKSAFNGGDKLRDEIVWILSLPPHLSVHFPQILDYSLEEHNTYYCMPFCEGPTLRRLFFETADYHSVFNELDSILRFLLQELYPHKKFKTPPDYFTRTHIVRAKQRIAEVRLESELYERLLQPEVLKVNGERLKNLEPLLEEVESTIAQLNLETRLLPHELAFVHGDLHFDNILVGAPAGFKLIDPRGFREGGDVAYDLGKLWHSFHGLYDLIHGDRFRLELDWSDVSCPAFRLDFNADLMGRYIEIGKWIRRRLDQLVTNDPGWELRTRFSEAFHFASLAPFHFKSQRTLIALHIQAVRLLSDCLAEVRSGV